MGLTTPTEVMLFDARRAREPRFVGADRRTLRDIVAAGKTEALSRC